MLKYGKNLTKSNTKSTNKQSLECDQKHPMATKNKKYVNKKIYLVDDHFLSAVLKLPAHHARPALKKSATKEERATARQETKKASVCRRYKKKAGDEYYTLTDCPDWCLWTSSWEAFDAFVNNPWGRLCIVAILRGYYRSTKAEIQILWEDVLEPKTYTHPNNYRKARVTLKRSMEDKLHLLGQIRKSVYVGGDDQQWSYVYHVIAKEDGTGFTATRGRYRKGSDAFLPYVPNKSFNAPIPLCVYKSEDVHALSVWFCLVGQEGNQKVKMATLESCYKGSTQHRKRIKERLVALLLWLKQQGCVEILGIAHTRMAAKNIHSTSKGEDYLESYERTTGYYLHYQLTHE